MLFRSLVFCLIKQSLPTRKGYSYELSNYIRTYNEELDSAILKFIDFSELELELQAL